MRRVSNARTNDRLASLTRLEACHWPFPAFETPGQALLVAGATKIREAFLDDSAYMRRKTVDWLRPINDK
jgi:hypothetical protein